MGKLKTLTGWAWLVLFVVGLLLIGVTKSFEGGDFAGAIVGVVLFALGCVSIVVAFMCGSFWLGFKMGRAAPAVPDEDDG